MKRVIRASQTIKASTRESSICDNAANALIQAMNVLEDYVDEAVFEQMEQVVDSLKHASISFKEGH